MKAKYQSTLISFFITLALTFGVAQANQSGPTVGSIADFKWACELEGGTYEDGLNYYQCKFSNGDKVTCSRDVDQCEVCVNGKCTVNNSVPTSPLDKIKPLAMKQKENQSSDSKPQVGDLMFNTGQLKQELVLASGTDYVTTGVSSFSLSTSSYAAYEYKNGVSLWLNLVNGDTAVIRFHEMDEVLPENSYSVKSDGKNHYYVHFWINKLDTNFNILSRVANLQFHYHFISQHSYLGVSGFITPGFAN